MVSSVSRCRFYGVVVAVMVNVNAVDVVTGAGVPNGWDSVYGLSDFMDVVVRLTLMVRT